MSGEYFKTLETDDKAGYNQAGKITELLSALRGSFTNAMMHNEFNDALESCRAVLNIISGKASAEIIEEMDNIVFGIEAKLQEANRTYTSEGGKYWSYPEKRILLKRELESLWRNLENIQDEYGYGMFSEDDSGL